MKTSPSSPLEPAMTCIADYALSQNPELLNCKQFTAAIDSLSDLQLGALAHLMDANRMTVQLYQELEPSDSRGACKLKACLKPGFDYQIARRFQRDAVLRELVTVLEDAGIDYAVFKTLNSSGWVGVDIDVIIASSNYELCVQALLENGFYSIDDLSKKYATGFMVRGNPIIVDLHTELAVLGVRYISAELLLQNSKSATIEVQGNQGFDSFSFSIADETVEALTRIAHSVLKEGTITLGELEEICRVPVASMVNYIDREGLQLSASVFACRSLYLKNAEQFAGLLMFKESILHYLAKDILVNSIHNPLPPFRIPAAVCALAFMDRLKNKGELGRCAPRLLYSFKFQRNAAHLGHKLLERITAR
jgi:hypothetical protein